MSLKNDFEASGKDAQGYIRLIWEETTLSPRDFERLIFDLGADRVWTNAKKIAIETIEEKTISNDRERLYKKNLTEFERSAPQKEKFREWVSYLLASVQDNNLRKELLANFMTRILRGELCMESAHRDLTATQALLKEKEDVWEKLLQTF